MRRRSIRIDRWHAHAGIWTKKAKARVIVVDHFRRERVEDGFYKWFAIGSDAAGERIRITANTLRKRYVRVDDAGYKTRRIPDKNK